MKTHHLFAILILFLICFSYFQVSRVYAVSDDSTAASALANAESDVASAYVTVLNAERAGANISSILVRLNEANGNLGQAEMSYRQGDFDSAVSFASASSTLAQQVKANSETLRLEALGPQYADAFFKMTLSIFAIIVSFVGTFWVWRIFKKRYTEKLMRRKPEVVS